jgi:hypothetical protein
MRIGVDSGAGNVIQAVDRQRLVLLPELDGADVAVEVGGDLLPRVEAGRPAGRRVLFRKSGAAGRQGHGRSRVVNIAVDADEAKAGSLDR